MPRSLLRGYLLPAMTLLRFAFSLALTLPFHTPAATPARPAAPDFDAKKLNTALRHVETEIASGRLGAAALLVARHGNIAVARGFGRVSREPGAPLCEPDSVFLVASITKPVTVTALMKLVEQGRLQLDDPVQRHLPEFRGDGRERVTVRQLLTHTSGLPDMLPDNIELRRRQAPLADFVAGALRTPLLFVPGSRVSYQSMGTLLASEIVTRLSGQPLDAFLRREVFGPLGMTKTSMGLGGRRIADTVWCDLPTRGSMTMSAEDRAWDWNSSYWRGLGAPWGGMHSTVGDIQRLLQAMLADGGRILKPELARSMLVNQNAGLNPPWGLGWKIGAGTFFEGSPAGLFGHSGATGTLCWADPERQIVFVLLTNRPSVEDAGEFVKTVARLAFEASNTTGESGAAIPSGAATSPTR